MAENRDIQDSDSARITPTARLVAKKISSDGTDAIRIEDGSSRSIAADQDSAGNLSLDARTPSRRNETGTLKVAETLVEALNGSGAAWAPPERATGREQGIDCIAAGPDRSLLLIQVTRPARPSFWRQLKTLGQATHTLTARDAADLLFKAISRKAARTASKDRKRLTLALDVTDTPEFALDAVAREFRTLHTSAVGEIGFASVWLVGEVASLTKRLDA